MQVPAEHGWSHVVVDGQLIRAETTTSVKGDTINAWYSGVTPATVLGLAGDLLLLAVVVGGELRLHHNRPGISRHRAGSSLAWPTNPQDDAPRHGDVPRPEGSAHAQ
ncbi:MAG: hypothetical protein WCG47_32880 [Dermatophilaceae bacterium]